MKRKQNTIYDCVAFHTRSKKPCLSNLSLPTRKYLSEWIPATKTRNFMLNDTLVDWLKEHRHGKNSNNILNNKYIKKDNFFNFITEKGNNFEDAVVKYINNNKLPIITVSKYINDESVERTIELMKSGTPIIHSAPVRNYKNRTNGIIDFLVRSDYLHKLIDNCPLTKEEQKIPSPKLNLNYHYVVIDVKFSTLPLRSDGRHILNTGSYPAYKSQCLIYTEAVGLIQGYKSRYAYILGRRWTYISKNKKYNNFSCFNKLGVIDYEQVDQEYITQTQNALRWIRDNKKNGHKWNLSPPTRKELYPNMCHDSGKWQVEKEKIAKEIFEITSIWNCGIKNRKKALEIGIENWKNSECKSVNLGIKGYRANVVDQIININRQTIDNIRPKKIENNIHNWKIKGNEIFVDFETLSDIFYDFDDLPNQKNTDMIFMIGVWYMDNIKREWVYKRFTCKKITYEEEFRIMDQFSTFYRNKNNPKIWYWHAEKQFWNKSTARQFNRQLNSQLDQNKSMSISTNWKINNWADLCHVFKKEPIVIRNCFKFGLKNISNAMREHNLIKTKIESECSSGMTAMIKAWKCYKDYSDPDNCLIMQDISKYNKFDCCVLQEIITYLRNNHT